MKFSLTITDASPSELSALLASLGGSTLSTMPQTTNGDDETGDDNGPVNVNAPAVDTTGLPWDERIHSGNKEMTDKGVWRKRRGVSDAIKTAVEAELRAKAGSETPMHREPQPMQPAAAPVMQPQPAPMPAPVMQMPAPQNGYPTGPGYPQQPGNVTAAAPAPMQQPMQPAAAPVMQMPAPAAPQQPGPAMDFPTFMQALSGQMQKRNTDGTPLIDTDYLARTTSEIATAFGVPLGVITDIVSQPRAAEMIVYAVQCMQRDQKWN